MLKRKKKWRKLPLSLQCMLMRRRAWLNTSSRKLVWPPFSSMQACARTGRCTSGCSRLAPRWMRKIEISSQLIRATSYTVHTQEVTVSLRLWIPWRPVSYEMSTHCSIADIVPAIVSLDTSINSSRRIVTQSSVIKVIATEIRGETMISMMSEKMTLSKDLSLFTITRDKTQLVEAIDSKHRNVHKSNQCRIEHSKPSSNNWCRNQPNLHPQKRLKRHNREAHHAMIHIVRVKKYFRIKPPSAKEAAIQVNSYTVMVKM